MLGMPILSTVKVLSAVLLSKDDGIDAERSEECLEGHESAYNQTTMFECDS